MTECEIHKTHNPSVAQTVRLHPLTDPLVDSLVERGVPVPRISPRKAKHVCPTGKANVEQYALYLLGKRKPLPVRVGPETKELAQMAVSIYEAAIAKHAKR